ncbi:hypothetical protein KAS79_00775 [Candidatus Parcubacteria bacterium]|nr:hypothetical protein [Candidatus Parcubacteria bacterium]
MAKLKKLIEKFSGSYILISVVGPHAGELEKEIFQRKIKDIDNVGFTFWIIRSFQAKLEMVQTICKKAKIENKNVFCIFIKPSIKGGATPTKNSLSAKYYSQDKKQWKKIPNRLSPVTGKIDKTSYALLFNKLELISDEIDLWNYADFFNQEKPIRIFRGGSTLCAIKKDVKNQNNKIKSRYRKIIAIGKLSKPFCVWLK